jgi:hypothetical protein
MLDRSQPAGRALPTTTWLIPIVVRDVAMGLANLVVAGALLAGGVIDGDGDPAGEIIVFAVVTPLAGVLLWLFQERRTVRQIVAGIPPPPAGTQRMPGARTVAEAASAVTLIGLCSAAAAFGLARIDALDVELWTTLAGVAAGWGLCMLAAAGVLGRWQRRHGATLLLRDGALFATADGGRAPDREL